MKDDSSDLTILYGGIETATVELITGVLIHKRAQERRSFQITDDVHRSRRGSEAQMLAGVFLEQSFAT